MTSQSSRFDEIDLFITFENDKLNDALGTAIPPENLFLDDADRKANKFDATVVKRIVTYLKVHTKHCCTLDGLQGNCDEFIDEVINNITFIYRHSSDGSKNVLRVRTAGELTIAFKTQIAKKRTSVSLIASHAGLSFHHEWNGTNLDHVRLAPFPPPVEQEDGQGSGSADSTKNSGDTSSASKNATVDPLLSVHPHRTCFISYKDLPKDVQDRYTAYSKSTALLNVGS